MIRCIYELPTAYNPNTIIKAGRCFHNFSSSSGRYYEMFLGRDIMVDLSWHKYKIVYTYAGMLREIVFMTEGKLNVDTLLSVNGTPLTMYPIWCKRYDGRVGPVAKLAQSFLFVDSINELLSISDIIPDMNIPFAGVQSLARFIREVIIRAYGSSHGYYLNTIAYGMANTAPQDIVGTITSVMYSGCDSMSLDYEVYETLIGDTLEPKEDWIQLISVMWSQLDPLSTWFATGKHSSIELRNHLDMNYNVDTLPQIAEYMTSLENRSSGLFPMMSDDVVSADYDPSQMDCILDYVMSSYATDLKFCVNGNSITGLQDRYMDVRNIYQNPEMIAARDSHTYINDTLVHSLVNQQKDQPGFPLPQQSFLEVEKTWAEELWIRNTMTGETHYADIVWRVLASSLGMVNKTITNQLQ